MQFMPDFTILAPHFHLHPPLFSYPTLVPLSFHSLRDLSVSRFVFHLSKNTGWHLWLYYGTLACLTHLMLHPAPLYLLPIIL